MAYGLRKPITAVKAVKAKRSLLVGCLLTEAEFFNSLTELTLWEKRLGRLCLIEQSTWGIKALFLYGGGVCQQLEQGFPTATWS